MPIDPEVYQGLSDGAKIIIILIIVGLPVLGTITVVLIQSLATKVREIDEKTNTIQEQGKTTVEHVANDHSSNLRDDLDKKVGGLDDKLDRLIELNAQQVLATQAADHQQGQRMNTLVERVNDLSSRVRRVESRKRNRRQEPES